MKRKFYERLVEWKSRGGRMPLVLMGARQVGKTYLLTQFGKNQYEDIHVFNFQENPALCNIFKKDLNPARILEELSISQRKDININNDFVLFDEVQECDEAVTSLKYFYEKLPELHIAAAGSLLGIKLNSSSFPVGMVEIFHLYPMTFGEFLEASSDNMAIRLYSEISRLETAHNVLWDYARQYFFVGGMPRAVEKWFSVESINARINSVRKIQNDILTGYDKDFAKHSGKINALYISTLFNNIPLQLSRMLDGSVKRFRFKDVLPNKRTYSHLSNTIAWLENAGLVYKVFSIECRPQIPLRAFTKENKFKLFLFDIGMLGATLDLSYKDLMGQDYGMTKGFFAENYVACEFKTLVHGNLYSWAESKSEIEFLYVTAESEIIPVEVKSGSRTKAKSLKSYIERYSPERTVKLVGKVGGSDRKNLVLPLYYAGKLNEILDF
jgi:predicted AAA+ superfamily ATPase